MNVLIRLTLMNTNTRVLKYPVIRLFPQISTEHLQSATIARSLLRSRQRSRQRPRARSYSLDLTEGK